MSKPSIFNLFCPPYVRLTAMEAEPQVWRKLSPQPGTALVWCIRGEAGSVASSIASSRPGGTALMVVLPPTSELVSTPSIWRTVGGCRPQSVLPFHEDLSLADLARLLCRPPEDLGAAVTDYLTWRGIPLDADTVRLVRRTMELSRDLSSVSALARCLYMSRRALGRRFSKKGLPVPSHWLQFGRLIRLVISLQNSKDNLSTVACSLGFPDGYAASNQMYRLLGLRPRSVRDRLGWEWVTELWLRREAEHGGFVPEAEFVERSEAPVEESRRRVLAGSW